jgi:hypothetical protein
VIYHHAAIASSIILFDYNLLRIGWGLYYSTLAYLTNKILYNIIYCDRNFSVVLLFLGVNVFLNHISAVGRLLHPVIVFSMVSIIIFKF